MPPPPDQHDFSAPHANHSTLREGVAAGLLGGFAVAAWYFVIDLVAGRPLHTPNVLGRLVFFGASGPPEIIHAPSVLGYTVIHFAAFAVVGIGLAALMHLAIRDISLRMGVWIGLVVAFGLFNGVGFLLSQATGDRLEWGWALGGSLAAVVVMGVYLWRGHPEIRRSFESVPLGDEVESPPHPPAR